MNRFETIEREMIEWRHHLHRNPEFGFEEINTAAFVAEKLRSWGIQVIEGVGKTGVVGSLTLGTGKRAIALRADMDALRISERSDLPYRSQALGTMHACGHDGHVAMLLGAARILAEEGGFDGTVRFVFQPAEEWGRGALSMLDDGLMARFPFSEVYGIHNMPGMPVGRFATRIGSIMAAEDIFEIRLDGTGGHAARPHHTNEVLVAACALVVNLQTIVSRRLDPADMAVVSVTELIADGTRNALPGTATILGDARSMRSEVSAEIERRMRQIVDGTASAYGCSASIATAVSSFHSSTHPSKRALHWRLPPPFSDLGRWKTILRLSPPPKISPGSWRKFPVTSPSSAMERRQLPCTIPAMTSTTMCFGKGLNISLPSRDNGCDNAHNSCRKSRSHRQGRCRRRNEWSFHLHIELLGNVFIVAG
ncbi:amidohydrolase [Rhizobium sp. BE258]|nr:amidohydrolase [Rhizobium sp. BE258]